MDTTQLLTDKFPESCIKPLVGAIQRAYSANADCHDPLLGHDEMSYGLLLYKSIKHFIANIADSNPEIRVQQHSPRFLFEAGGFQLSSYRAGDPYDLDPSEAFPKNRHGAWELASYNQRQRSFFETPGFAPTGTGWSESNLPSLILAHCGNFEAGLSQIFLGVPDTVDENRRISGWEATRVLWQRGDGMAGALEGMDPNGPDSTRPKIELVAPPKLVIRRKTDTGTND